MVIKKVNTRTTFFLLKGIYFPLHEIRCNNEKRDSAYDKKKFRLQVEQQFDYKKNGNNSKLFGNVNTIYVAMK